VAGTAVAAPEIEPKAAPETETKGYRVTQHVSTYYDKARF
jgi:hypothetical protein